jgi:hypothetical protein
MHVAYINKNEPKPAIQYKCNVCGLYFGWRKESSYYEKSVGKGYDGYDAQFVLCSDKCHKEAIEKGLINKFYNK